MRDKVICFCSAASMQVGSKCPLHSMSRRARFEKEALCNCLLTGTPNSLLRFARVLAILPTRTKSHISFVIGRMMEAHSSSTIYPCVVLRADMLVAQRLLNKGLHGQACRRIRVRSAQRSVFLERFGAELGTIMISFIQPHPCIRSVKHPICLPDVPIRDAPRNGMMPVTRDHKPPQGRRAFSLR